MECARRIPHSECRVPSAEDEEVVEVECRVDGRLEIGGFHTKQAPRPPVEKLREDGKSQLPCADVADVEVTEWRLVGRVDIA
jgi:hypothetical protein